MCRPMPARKRKTPPTIPYVRCPNDFHRQPPSPCESPFDWPPLDEVMGVCFLEKVLGFRECPSPVKRSREMASSLRFLSTIAGLFTFTAAAGVQEPGTSHPEGRDWRGEMVRIHARFRGRPG